MPNPECLYAEIQIFWDSVHKDNRFVKQFLHFMPKIIDFLKLFLLAQKLNQVTHKKITIAEQLKKIFNHLNSKLILSASPNQVFQENAFGPALLGFNYRIQQYSMIFFEFFLQKCLQDSKENNYYPCESNKCQKRLVQHNQRIPEKMNIFINSTFSSFDIVKIDVLWERFALALFLFSCGGDGLQFPPLPILYKKIKLLPRGNCGDLGPCRLRGEQGLRAKGTI